MTETNPVPERKLIFRSPEPDERMEYSQTEGCNI